MSPLLLQPQPLESTGCAPKCTKAPQEAISTAGLPQSVWALRGGDVVSKGEFGRLDVLLHPRQSPAHVSSISFVPGNDTQLNVRVYQRSTGGWIYSVEGACLVEGMPKLRISSQCVGCGEHYAVLVVVQANRGFMRSRLGFLSYLIWAPPTIIFRHLSSALICELHESAHWRPLSC